MVTALLVLKKGASVDMVENDGWTIGRGGYPHQLDRTIFEELRTFQHSQVVVVCDEPVCHFTLSKVHQTT
jgi:hypothetical protein